MFIDACITMIVFRVSFRCMIVLLVILKTFGRIMEGFTMDDTP